jgi:hypothetical protein
MNDHIHNEGSIAWQGLEAQHPPPHPPLFFFYLFFPRSPSFFSLLFNGAHSGVGVCVGVGARAPLPHPLPPYMPLQYKVLFKCS